MAFKQSAFTDDEYPTARWNLKWDACHPHSCRDLMHPLRGLAAHAYALGEILRCVASSRDLDGWLEVGELLRVVGGLARVNVTTAKYSDDPAYCETVMDWENARSRVVSAYATDLTRLLFAYNAFETALANVVSRRALKRKPQWELSRSVLQEHIGEIMPVITHYECSVESLLCVGRSWDKTAFDEIADHPGIADSLRAMDLVQVVRNRCVHEGIRFPSEPAAAKLSERGVLRRSTRLSIMTIQLFAMIAFKELLGDGIDDEIAELSTMHLMPDDASCGDEFE